MRDPRPADTDRPAQAGDARLTDDRGRAHDVEMIGMGYYPDEIGLTAPPVDPQA